VAAALVVSRKGSFVTAGDLKSFCLAHGPAYAHPRYVELIEALPLNGAGKIDRSVVASLLKTSYGKLGADQSSS
jgi:long-chain acyl-CoA synthetase